MSLTTKFKHPVLLQLNTRVKTRWHTIKNAISRYIYALDHNEWFADYPWQTGGKTPRLLHGILWATLAFITISLVWAHFAILDEITVAEGKVIPSSQIQIIQNLEGGIIQKLYVNEGRTVEKGQVLMQLDPTRFSSSYQESLAKALSLKLKIARLTAEMNGQNFVPTPLPLQNEADLVQQEQALYAARQTQLHQLIESRDLTQKQIDMTTPLIKQGAASPIEVLRLRKDLSETEQKIQDFRSQALNDLTKAKADLEALNQANLADEDRLERTTIRSPMKGIVKQIKVTTIGGVVQPGMDLMEIVPLDDSLLIEAKVRPGDIGFLHSGQKATVKITAYDYAIYGGLSGTVEQISADTIVDEKDQKQQSYYLIRVRTQKNYLGNLQKPLYIIPGMLASVDVVTGHHSVLHYLLKPLLRAKERALRER